MVATACHIMQGSELEMPAEKDKCGEGTPSSLLLLERSSEIS